MQLQKFETVLRLQMPWYEYYFRVNIWNERISCTFLLFWFDARFQQVELLTNSNIFGGSFGFESRPKFGFIFISFSIRNFNYIIGGDPLGKLFKVEILDISKFPLDESA